MILTYLGKHVNPAANIEFIPEKENKFGFIAIVTYKPGSSYAGHDQNFHNLTEVHNNFNYDGSIAFESDIHSTGCTREIRGIETCDIVLATELAENY